MPMRPTLCLAAVFFFGATLAQAGERAYVACDNGLRCVTAPCPSTTVHALATGRQWKGVSPDIGRLSETDQQRIRDTDALYFGRLVLRGHVEQRVQKIAGRRQELPVLLVTGILREARPAERRQCPKG
jgi:hypothetical protein